MDILSLWSDRSIIWSNIQFCLRFFPVGQNIRSVFRLVGQFLILVGHCLMSDRYFKACHVETAYTACRFRGRGAPWKRDFWECFVNFRFESLDSFPMDDVKEKKWKVRTVKLIFHIVSKNVVAYDVVTGKVLLSLTYFQKFKNENFEKRFFPLRPDPKEKNVLRFL